MSYLFRYRCTRKELALISNIPQKLFIKCVYPWCNCVKYSVSIPDSDVYSKCCLLQEVQKFYTQNRVFCHFKEVNEWSDCIILTSWWWISHASGWVQIPMVQQLLCGFDRKPIWLWLPLSNGCGKTGFLTEPTPLPRVKWIIKCLSKKASISWQFFKPMDVMNTCLMETDWSNADSSKVVGWRKQLVKTKYYHSFPNTVD